MGDPRSRHLRFYLYEKTSLTEARVP
jgi:hypothetical protein